MEFHRNFLAKPGKYARAVVSKSKICCLTGSLLTLCIVPICLAKESQHVDLQAEPVHSAIAELSKSLQKNPKDYAARYRRAVFYGQLRDYPNAISDFSAAIKLNPCSTPSTKAAGNKKSVACFYLALSYQNRGLTYLRMEQYKKGLDDISKAITLRPEYAPNYQTRAMFLEKLGNIGGAKHDYERYNALVYEKQHGISHAAK
jgi:Tfp pilus assembly protein PilF